MDIKVGTLAEYLEKIGQFSNRSFSFRGEHGKHDSRLSKASRIEKIDILPDENGHYTKPMASGYADFMRVVDEFYTSVAHRLTDIEKEQFVPFSEHYGIPTNLINITSSPLSALFFACYRAKCHKCENPNDSKTENGYVYIFHNNSHFIDVTDIIGYNDWNIYDTFYLGNRTVISKIYDKITDFFNKQFIIWSGDKHIGDDTKNQMIFSAYYLATFLLEEKSLYDDGKIKDGILIEREARKHTDEKIESITTETLIPMDELKKLRDLVLADPVMKRFPIDLFDGSNGYNSFLDNISCIYTILMFYCCNCDTIRGRGLLLFPNMIYKPKLTFDRARQQQGYFIYQAYFAIEDSYLCFQEIQHNHVIEIENTDEILNQLDSIGINIGTIYGDFDSIATHLRDKFILEATAAKYSKG